MEAMTVIYHNDQDGRCSAFLVKHFLPDYEIKFIEASYETDFSSVDIQKGEEVWIVDFAFEPDVMRDISLRADLTWIDHHASTFSKFQEAGVDLSDVKGIRDPSKAACVWTYNYFLGMEVTNEPIPLFVKMIGDFDAWIGEYGDDAFYLMRGLEAYDTYPRSNIWERVWNDPDTFIKNGAISETWFRPFVARLIEEFAFECEFPPGYKCLAINAPSIRNSKYFERYCPGYDIWISYKYANGAYSISIYSTTVDVSKIAEQYWYNGRRGGGHKGASGFRIEHPPFLDVIVPPNHQRDIIMKPRAAVLQSIGESLECSKGEGNLSG